MSFVGKIKDLGQKARELKQDISTEEATKTALILPFIAALGYDIFNPLEVIPEYIADVGIKKGEKVDYCICSNRKPQIIIECKHWTKELSYHNTQLLRYFHVTPAKFAVLTNGLQYRFYTDLDSPNLMDKKPFLDFDITQITETTIAEIEKFAKSQFDLNAILSNALELKYVTELKSIIASELENPSDKFVRFFAKQVYNGTITSNVVSSISPLLKKAFTSCINDTISKRLNVAIENRETPKTESNKTVPTNPKTFKPPISPASNKSKSQKTSIRKKIKATFPDGTVITGNKVAHTFAEIIQKIGGEKVSSLGIVRSGIPLVATFYDDTKSQYQIGDYYVMTHSSTKAKMRDLKEIMTKLDLNIQLELI